MTSKVQISPWSTELFIFLVLQVQAKLKQKIHYYLFPSMQTVTYRSVGE